jgi:hypothetical protein
MKTGSWYDIGKPTANERRAHAVVVPVSDRHRAGDLGSLEPPRAIQGAGDAVGSPQPLADLRPEVRSPHRVFVDRVVSSDRTAGSLRRRFSGLGPDWLDKPARRQARPRCT